MLAFVFNNSNINPRIKKHSSFAFTISTSFFNKFINNQLCNLFGLYFVVSIIKSQNHICIVNLIEFLYRPNLLNLVLRKSHNFRKFSAFSILNTCCSNFRFCNQRLLSPLFNIHTASLEPKTQDVFLLIQLVEYQLPYHKKNLF